MTISHETRSKLNAEGGEYKEQRLGKAHGRAVSLEIESDELITLNGALCSSGVQSIWCRALSGVITGTNAALLALQCFAPPTTAAAATKAKRNQCPPPRAGCGDVACRVETCKTTQQKYRTKVVPKPENQKMQ